MIAAVLIAALAFSQTDMESAQGAPPPDRVARRLNINLDELAKIDNTQNQLARSIGRDLCCQCGTCPKEPVTDCRCGWAQMNRETIQHMVERGMNREQILAAYQAEYGDQVLGMLPHGGFRDVAWAAPYIAAIMAAVALALFARKYLRRGKRADLPPELEGRQDVQQDLARELSELD